MERLNPLKSVIWNLFLITTGALVFSFGAKAVLVHHHFLLGGLYGTCLLVNYSTNLLSPGILFLIANIPIMLLGFFLLSRRFFFYSLWAVVMVTAASEYIVYDLKVVDQLYAAVAGGVICGTGSGIILRSLGSGGGLDIIAILLNQKYNLGIGKFFLVYNLCLFSVAATLYEIDLLIASMILTVVSSWVLDQVLTLFNQRKIVYVLSDYTQQIADIIRTELKLGATIFDAKGAYTGKHKQMLMTITNNLAVKRLEEKVFDLDPKALFIVENSFNVIGSSFGKRKIY